MPALIDSDLVRRWAMDGRDSYHKYFAQQTPSVLHTNHTACFPGHHFFPVLVAADPTGDHLDQVFRRFHLDHQHLTGNRVAGEDRSMKLEVHFARNEVEIATYLGWQSRR